MQLNLDESVRGPLRPNRCHYLLMHGIGGFALATVLAALLAVASPGRLSAAPIIVSSARSANRTPAMAAQMTVSPSASPADVFMQAIVTQNGQLAWQQLCPELQTKVPAVALGNLMNGDKSTNQNVQLQVDAVGSHAWSDGGTIHVYVVTVHWPSAPDARMLFVLRTQASGCVDGILNA